MTLESVIKIGHVLIDILLVVGRPQIMGIEECNIDDASYAKAELCTD